MENNKELVKLLNKISQILGSEDERFTNLLNQLKTSINPTNIAREAETLAMKLIEERYCLKLLKFKLEIINLKKLKV